MKLLLTLISFFVSLLLLTPESKVEQKPNSSFGEYDSLTCPPVQITDIALVNSILSNSHHLTVKAREQLELPTYGENEFLGDSSHSDDHIYMLALITKFLNDKGVAIVESSEICSSITNSIVKLDLPNEIAIKRKIYFKIKDSYVVRFTGGPYGPSSPRNPIVKLDSMFNVIKVAKL